MKRSNSMPRDVWFWVLCAVLLLAVFLRFFNLEVKPLHHDEGVNGYFLDRLVEKDFYRYDPENYHGPLIYYLAVPFIKLFGRTILALRFVPALLGTLMVVLFWKLAERLGAIPAVGATAIVAASPTMVYFSREFIHEIYLAFFTLLFLVAVNAYAKTKKTAPLVLAAFSLALCFSTKETALVHLAVMLVSLLFALYGENVARQKGVWAKARELVERSARAVAVAICGQSFAIAISAGVFLMTIVVLFSSLFSNVKGVADFFSAFIYWSQTGVESDSHVKPAFYFVQVLWQTEPLILLLGAVGTALALRSRDMFERFVGCWAILTFLVYSSIPYKTPWLAINIILPLALAAAALLRRVQAGVTGRALPSCLAVVTFVGAIGWSAVKAGDLALVRYDNNNEPIVYVQTLREFNRLISRIDEVAMRACGAKTRILVCTEHHWPLDWYLHDYQNRDFTDVTSASVRWADLVVASIEQEEEVKQLAEGEFVVERYNVRPGASVTLFIRRAYAPDTGRLAGQAAPYLPLDSPRPLLTGLETRYFGNYQLLPPAFRTELKPVVMFRFDEEREKDFVAPISISYKGYLKISKTGEYTFFLTSDDGSKLFIDDVLLIDNWGEHAELTRTASATLAPGYHGIRVEYFDAGWGAVLMLEWRCPGGEVELIPPMSLYHQGEEAP